MYLSIRNFNIPPTAPSQPQEFLNCRMSNCLQDDKNWCSNALIPGHTWKKTAIFSQLKVKWNSNLPQIGNYKLPPAVVLLEQKGGNISLQFAKFFECFYLTNLRNSVSPGVRMFLAEFIKICKVWSSGVKMKLKDSLHSHTFSVILLRRNVFLRNSVYVSGTMLIITFFSYKGLKSMDTRSYTVKVIIAFLVVF